MPAMAAQAPAEWDKSTCSFDQWYPRFESHTWKSIVLPLRPAFLAYLRQDSVVLPDSAMPTQQTAGHDSSDDEAGFDYSEPSMTLGDVRADA
jgi:hypothetical protein